MSRRAKLSPGHSVEPRDLTTIDGDRIAIPDAERLTHLHFRRFAGCPICHVHVQAIRARHAEIEAAGIQEVVFFHSTGESLLQHLEDPMPMPSSGIRTKSSTRSSASNRACSPFSTRRHSPRTSAACA